LGRLSLLGSELLLHLEVAFVATLQQILVWILLSWDMGDLNVGDITYTYKTTHTKMFSTYPQTVKKKESL